MKEIEESKRNFWCVCVCVYDEKEMVFFSGRCEMKAVKVSGKVMKRGLFPYKIFFQYLLPTCHFFVYNFRTLYFFYSNTFAVHTASFFKSVILPATPCTVLYYSYTFTVCTKKKSIRLNVVKKELMLRKAKGFAK